MKLEGVDLALQGVADGCFDLIEDEEGEPVFDDGESYRVTVLVLGHLDRYWGDPRSGSRIHEVQYDKKNTGITLETYATEALKKAVPEYIKDVSSQATRKAVSYYKLLIRYTPIRSGKQKTAHFSLRT